MCLFSIRKGLFLQTQIKKEKNHWDLWMIFCNFTFLVLFYDSLVKLYVVQSLGQVNGTMFRDSSFHAYVWIQVFQTLKKVNKSGFSGFSNFLTSTSENLFNIHLQSLHVTLSSINLWIWKFIDIFRLLRGSTSYQGSFWMKIVTFWAFILKMHAIFMKSDPFAEITENPYSRVKWNP